MNLISVYTNLILLYPMFLEELFKYWKEKKF